MCNPKLGTSQNHDKQNWTRLDRFSVMHTLNNDNKHIHDLTKSQNNAHFITNNYSSVKTNIQSRTRLDRFSVTHIPNIDKQTHIHDVMKSQNNTVDKEYNQSYINPTRKRYNSTDQ